MKLYRRGATWWLTATVRGERLRLSTGETSEAQAWRRAGELLVDHGSKARPQASKRRQARPPRWLTPDEETCLLLFLEAGHRWLAEFLLDTGMRISEALALTKGDIQGDRAVVWGSKTGRERHVPLTRRATRAWERAGPFKATRSTFDKALRVAASRGGLRPVSAHALRHTCATRMATKGVPLKVAQAVLGHQSLEMTMHYTHLAESQLEEAREALEQPRPQLRSVK